MLTDFRYALRQLWKEPRFTLVAVLALAIGIGANTAIFSVVNAVLLKPLPYPQPNELVAFGSIDAKAPNQDDFDSVSYPDFFDFRAQGKSFAQLALYRQSAIALTGEGSALSLRRLTVTGNFFDTLGVRPQLGRAFRLDEEQADGGPDGLTVILSQPFWQRRLLGSSPPRRRRKSFGSSTRRMNGPNEIHGGASFRKLQAGSLRSPGPCQTSTL